MRPSFVVLLFIVLVGPASADGYVKLDAKQMQALFSKPWTRAGNNIRNWISFWSYRPDGTFDLTVRQDSGKHGTLEGTWYLEGASVCRQLETESYVRCLEFLSDGSARYLFRRTGGKHNQGYFYRIVDHDYEN